MCGSNGARGTFTWRLGQDEHHQLVHNPLVIAWFQILTSKVLAFLKGSGRLRNSIFSLQEIWINSKLVKLLDKYASKFKKKVWIQLYITEIQTLYHFFFLQQMARSWKILRSKIHGILHFYLVAYFTYLFSVLMRMLYVIEAGETWGLISYHRKTTKRVSAGK